MFNCFYMDMNEKTQFLNYIRSRKFLFSISRKLPFFNIHIQIKIILDIAFNTEMTETDHKKETASNR